MTSTAIPDPPLDPAATTSASSATAAPAITDLAKALADADAHIAKNEWEAAGNVLSAAPTTTPILDKLAFCLSRAKRYDAASDVLADLERRRPTEARYPYMRGYQLYEQERYADAIPHFLRAYRLDPKHLRNLYRLAQARLKTGEIRRAQLGAIEVLRLWHALPREAQQREATVLARASYMLGREQLKTDPSGAVELLRQAAEHDARDHDKHYLLGKALRRAGQPRDAINALRRAQRIKPRQLYIELELAVALADAGDRDEAGQLLTRLARRLRDWQALKGAHLAAKLDDPAHARSLLARAAEKGFVRRSSTYTTIKALVDDLPAAEPTDDRRAAGEECYGHIQMVNPDRNFGFLVDDADGTRRHFRLRHGFRPRRGDAVRYLPIDAEKGPAADVLGLRD